MVEMEPLGVSMMSDGSDDSGAVDASDGTNGSGESGKSGEPGWTTLSSVRSGGFIDGVGFV
ncbi:hypothetical protein J6X73_02820 [Candidatus Saccharibacteria bacterium]|nr:hypothetical protein [Candidatus Saccharibacteria bacterium]